MDYAIRTILLAIDLSDHAPEVARHALGLAQNLGAKVHVLHVLEPLSDYSFALLDTYLAPEIMEQLRRQSGPETMRQTMQQRLEQFCRERQAPASLIAEIKVTEGNPSEAILEEARRINAELIVMGSHGQTALSELFLGSVAHKLTIHSSAPVLLVPIKRD